MARLHTVGFELGSVAAGMEVSALSATSSPLSVQSTTKRSGGYALRCGGSGQPLVSGAPSYVEIRFQEAVTTGPLYLRAYIRFASFPSAENAVWAIGTTGNVAILTVDGSGVLRAYDAALSLLGTAGSGLSSGVWYRLEVLYDATGGSNNHLLSVYVDGGEVIAATTANFSSVFRLLIGGNLNGEAQTAGEWYVDDVAVNNAIGTVENTLPGAGSVVHLWPNADGDADTTVTRSSGSTTPTGTDRGANWQQLGSAFDKPTPNDGTDFLLLTANGSEVLVDCEASSVAGIGASDAVTLVQVGGRIRGVSVSTTNWIPRVMSQAGGTKLVGSTTSIVSATWSSHDDSVGQQQYKLTSYTDPQAGGAWTPALLDAMQIGAECTDANPDMLITALWALVEYVPAEGGGSFTLSAETGTFSIAGQAATLRASRRLSAEGGVFSIAGQAATLRAGRRLAADAGAFSIAGQAAALRAGRRLAADAGAFSIAGTAALLRADRRLPADAGVFAIAGTGAALRVGSRMAAESGAFVIAGQAATLRADRRLLADAGVFVIAGTEASLIHTAGARLDAESGVFTIVGTPTALLASRRLVAEAGAFAIVGQEASLRAGRRLSAEAGSFAIVGTPATLRAAYRLIADAGLFTIAGGEAALFTGGNAVHVVLVLPRETRQRALGAETRIAQLPREKRSARA